ncbi:hypothetical protein C8Q73DRAFT_790573 [Cubamyces lactineus]|nr:hypothetical protein C8Q73DRAFT_790573 [Cubamyces lactineus]
MTYLWISQKIWRFLFAVASPMPWSRTSLQDYALVTSVPEPVTFEVSDAHDPIVPDPMALNVFKQSLGAPMDIPWLGGCHDGYPYCSTLMTYAAIRRKIGAARPLREDAALWLSTMTLGLLEAVTRTRMRESAFVSRTRDGPTLSGILIQQFLALWASRLNNTDESDLDEHGRSVSRLLRRAMDAIAEESFEESSLMALAGLPRNSIDDIRATVAYTVRQVCLVVTCDVAAWRRLEEMNQLRQYLWRNSRINVDLAVRTSCKRRMQEAGFCPSVLSGLFRNQSLVSIISDFVRSAPYIVSAPNEHTCCQDDVCHLYNISDIDAYAPRHVHGSCSCQYIRPSLEVVHRLLSEEYVPAVRYVEGSGLQVLPAEKGRYVAISHVWAEGMGSTTDAGLPLCIVERIAGLAQALLPEHGGAFWIDSLSIPSAREPRKRAITLMAQTYRDAAKVLVIDGCIRTMCSQAQPWDENLFRIASSQWVRRVWTLQEGLLARQLCFEFLDGPVAIPDDLYRLLRYPQSKTLVPVLDFHAGEQSAGTIPLSETMRLLEGRRTTKAEDELIAVASLLPSRVRIEVLLAERDGPGLAARRMRSFLLQLREIPKEVPFGLSPRLTFPGFSWAPSTLGSGMHEVWKASNGVATCMEDGLIAEYCLAPLETPIPLTADSVYVYHPATKAAYVLTRILPNPETSSPPCETINTLLFLSNLHTMSDARITFCIAASSDGISVSTRTTSPTQGDKTASRSPPLVLKYVALYGIGPTPPYRERAIASGELVVASALGDISEVEVRLV